MCGFVCIFHRQAKITESDRVSLRRAGKKLAHRGPDDHGEYFDNDVGIFFNRLSILDTSMAGHQPMISHDGRFVLAMNGEIYNFMELRSELSQQGHTFTTRSDTEVLLKMVELQGEDCLKKLRGMFAFVVWDKIKRTLTVVRDRVGIKPLYIYKNKSSVVIASEIKAILDLCPESRILDERTIFKYLSRGWVDDSADTFFEPVKAVSPAHCMIISQNDQKSYRYWALKSPGNQPFKVGEFKDVFFETVKLHLRSDVPLAATLSGGMDSSSIVASARTVQKHNESFKAFSVIPENTLDESPWINKTVEYTGIDHSYLNISYKDLSSQIGKSLYYHDEPYQGSSCLYQYLLREEIAKTGVTVLLVGEGGDEVLGGYRRFLYPYLWALKNGNRSAEFDLALSGAADFMEMPTSTILENLRQYQETVTKLKDGQENKCAYGLLAPDFMDRYQDILSSPFYSNDEDLTGNIFFAQLHRHMFVRDIPYVLRMEDRNSMAHGLEARVPFLDHCFIETSFSYDYAEFMRGGRNKSMLRRAMKGVLPDCVSGRWSKSPRPGNNAHLVYDLLSNEIRDRFRDSDFDVMPYWGARLSDLFEKDLVSYDPQRAEAWFRVYLLSRWLKEVFADMETVK